MEGDGGPYARLRKCACNLLHFNVLFWLSVALVKMTVVCDVSKKSLPSLRGVNIILERPVLASSDLFILACRDYITHNSKTISLRDPYPYQA